ncbi:YcaO-like family protein [Halorussus sp. MSC15.2]|uniref:YcaO-like family protein n=1 Tax=Halorussus sp. MSC15.2 TaxID=2283638 RepID=UPI0013D068C4|nr:YcaO-like family protein [Halorussus sp. MSC15.2]NEU55570.1 bacteriocin biosynthesis protein SagD [Halorussus sp. MSC15.2]
MGKGATVDEAIASAAGEFVERYCAFWQPERARRASYRSLEASEETVPDFEYLAIYDADQLREMRQSPLTREADIQWVEGRNIRDGSPVAVPAGRVYMASPDPYFYTTSNGLACERTLAGAVVGGIYESVERDAIMQSWFRQEPPVRVRLDGRPDLAERRDAVETADTSVSILDFESELPFHVVGAFFLDECAERPKALLAAGASLDFATAVEDALSELSQGLTVLKEDLAFGGESDAADRAPETRFDNVRHYARPENADALSILLDGEVASPEYEPVEFETDRDELRACLRALEAGEVTPLAVDVTTKDVRDTGLYVTRVVVPELIPLSRPAVPPRRHPRLSDGGLNDDCHPIG